MKQQMRTGIYLYTIIPLLILMPTVCGHLKDTLVYSQLMGCIIYLIILHSSHFYGYVGMKHVLLHVIYDNDGDQRCVAEQTFDGRDLEAFQFLFPDL